MPSICTHFIVSGRVQGVFYRASTQRKATELGLTGWARNLPDGRVEVLACGDEASLNELEKWLWVGPTQAKVSEIEVSDTDFQEFKGFSVS